MHNSLNMSVYFDPKPAFPMYTFTTSFHPNMYMYSIHTLYMNIIKYIWGFPEVGVPLVVIHVGYPLCTLALFILGAKSLSCRSEERYSVLKLDKLHNLEGACRNEFGNHVGNKYVEIYGTYIYIYIEIYGTHIGNMDNI